MLSRRRFLQLVASSIVALAARPKEVFASTGNIDGEQIQFTSEIAQELADKYIKGLLGYSYTPSDPIPFVDVDGSPLGYIVPVVTSNRAAGYLVLDASDDEILTGYRFGDGLVSPMDRGGDLGVESYSFNNPVVMINPFEFGVQSLDGSITTNCGRTIPAVSIEGRPVVLSNKPSKLERCCKFRALKCRITQYLDFVPFLSLCHMMKARLRGLPPTMLVW